MGDGFWIEEVEEDDEKEEGKEVVVGEEWRGVMIKWFLCRIL